jgi:hypothetical protein
MKVRGLAMTSPASEIQRLSCASSKRVTIVWVTLTPTGIITI